MEDGCEINLVPKPGYFRGFGWKLGFLIALFCLHFYCGVLQPLALIFSGFVVFCNPCVLISTRDTAKGIAGRLLWWCPTSAVLGVERTIHLPVNAVVQSKTETTDWLREVACVVNPGFVLLTDLYWDIIFLPHWLPYLECSWVPFPHPPHESINKAATKLRYGLHSFLGTDDTQAYICLLNRRAKRYSSILASSASHVFYVLVVSIWEHNQLFHFSSFRMSCRFPPGLCSRCPLSFPLTSKNPSEAFSRSLWLFNKGSCFQGEKVHWVSYQ